MKVRELVQELLINSSLDDEVVVSYQDEDYDYSYGNISMVVKYEDNQVGIVCLR